MHLRFLWSPNISTSLIALLPIGLWLLTIASLKGDPDRIPDIINPAALFNFIRGVQSFLPVVTVLLAVAFIGYKYHQRIPVGKLFLGPLGLTAIYGLVGIISTTQSPDQSIAIYWAVSYLSVPLVLLAIVTGPKSLQSTTRLLNVTLVIILIVSAGLVIYGLFKINFGGFILNPTNWLDCTSQGWFNESSGNLRRTGVGRFAAITGIISLGGLWNPKYRLFWAPVLILSVFLLFHAGARTSFAGFFVAAPIVILLFGGKRAALSSAVVIVALIPIFWATGIHKDFLDKCIYRLETASTSPIAKSTDDNIPTDQNVIRAGSKASPNTGSQLPGAISLNEPEDLAYRNTSPIKTGKTEGPFTSEFLEFTGEPEDLAYRNTNPIKTGKTEGPFTSEFLEFTGRTKVWEAGLKTFSASPILGYGFQADRLLLETHAHNSIIQALLQTGGVGTLPFIAALIIGWYLLIRTLRQLNRLSKNHKSLVISVVGLLTFFSIRSIFESTGAYFSVDWLILAPILLYIQIISSEYRETKYK